MARSLLGQSLVAIAWALWVVAMLIGRAGATAELAFDRLRDDLDAAVAAVHEDRRGGPR